MNKKILLSILVVIFIAVAIFVFNKKHMANTIVSTSNYTITCDIIDSNTIKCGCDIVIGDSTEHHEFSNTLNATSCDNNMCHDLCENYVQELQNK